MKVPSRPNDKCYVRLVDDIPDDHTGDTYDQVFITDDEEIYQWASEDRYRLRMIKFLQKYKCIRYILDCSHDVNAVWKSVVWADEIINEEEPIFVTDTLILHCGSIESYRKVIPRIRGSYNRLVLHGHMSWFQVKQLIHPNVKQVRINATFEMLPVEIERENFVNYIMKHCRGAEYKFVIAYESKCPKELLKRLHIALRSHESHGTTNCDRCYPVIDSVRNAIHFISIMLFVLMPFAPVFYYVEDKGTQIACVIPFLLINAAIVYFILIPVPLDLKNDVVIPDFSKFNRYLNDN